MHHRHLGNIGAFGLVAGLLVGMLGLGSCSFGADRKADAAEGADSNELRIAVTHSLAIDPVRVAPTDAADVLATDLLFDGLTRSDGETVAPELASSWESEDGLTWTFRLDPSRVASDGSPITAERVVASLEKVRSQASTSLAAARLAIVSDVRADGDGAVRITLASVDRDLPALLADPAFGIVPNSDNSPQVASDTVTSGRYRVRSGGSEGTTLVPIDPRAVHLSGIQFVRYENEERAATAFAKGKVDIVPLADGASSPEGATVVVPTAATLVLEASAQGALGDPTQRAALVHAIDRDALAEAVTGDRARRADTLVPGGIVNDGPCAAACDTTAAAAGLTGPGRPVRIDVPDGLVSDTGAEELERQLTAAGVTVEVRRTDAAGMTSRVAGGEVDLALFAVTGTTPSPDPYLEAVLGSTGAENVSGYGNAAFDDGLAAARDLTDDGARRAKYAEIEALTLDEPTVIPLVTLGRRYAVADRVTGVVPVAGRLFDGAAVRLR